MDSTLEQLSQVIGGTSVCHSRTSPSSVSTDSIISSKNFDIFGTTRLFDFDKWGAHMFLSGACHDGAKVIIIGHKLFFILVSMMKNLLFVLVLLVLVSYCAAIQGEIISCSG